MTEQNLSRLTFELATKSASRSVLHGDLQWSWQPESKTALFDLFRVEEGKIVEHWDVVSQIPTGMARENGKF